MIKPFSTLFAAVLAATVGAQPAFAQQLQTQIVATGLDRPLFATSPAGDSRLFIVEQGGLIKVLQNGAVLPTPFLDLSDSVNTEGERGLLGMAFDPNFASNHRFYVDYIDKTTLNTVVATYQVGTAQPNVADAASAQTILTVAQPEFNNHKAGWIGFRPGEANNLYIATATAGSAMIPEIAHKIFPRISARFSASTCPPIVRLAILPNTATRYRRAMLQAETLKSTLMGCAIRSATVSTAKPAPSTLGMSGKTHAKRSTMASLAAIMGGASLKAHC